MNKNAKLLIGLACMSLGLTGCKEDYFDQEEYDKRVKNYFPVGKVDPSHTWATYGSAKANISVGGSAGQNYRVAVYQGNPLTASSVTLLASANVVSGQQPVALNFSYQLADPIVYVACYDEMNRRVVEAVKVSNGGTYGVNFFGASTSSARSFSGIYGQHTTRSIRVEKGVSTLSLNGTEVSSPEGFFTHDTTGKFNFNTKFSNAGYHDPYTNTDLTFSSGLKMEGSTKVMFTTSYYSNITIVQSSWQDNNNNSVTHSIKFDGTELNLGSAGWGTNCRVHTVTNVPAGTHTITRATGEQGIFFVAVEQYALEEVTIDPSSFARTAADYLTPTTMVGSSAVVNGINVAQMQAYEAFTNTDIDDNNYNILLDGATWTETIGGSSSGGTTVNLNYTAVPYLVSAGDNPSNEASRDIVYSYGNNETLVVATIKFGGTGNAAEEASRTNGSVTYGAKITRPYYLFTPLVNCQGNIEIDDTYNGVKNFVVFDQTTNSQVSSTQWYQGGSLFVSNLQANHTYKLSLDDNTPMSFYGMSMQYSGDITVGGEATEPTVITHTNRGDGHHYRVASGTEITKPIAVNASFTSSGDTIYNDQVIYVEGKLNLYSTGTLNGPTIVVANGGEVAVHGTVNSSNAARIVVLPGGTLSGDKYAVLNVNNGAPSYNGGTIDFEGTLNVNGCNFYNCGTIDVDVLTCTSTGLLTNYGSITAKHNSDAASAYNCTFANACYMHFTEHAGIGQLFMLPNSRLDVDGYCEFNQSWQDINQITNPNILCDKSVVNVQTAYVTNTMFQGPAGDGEFAVVKMQNVQVGNGDDIHQSMNCYFDWNITEVYKKDGGRGVCTSNYLINGENSESANQYLKTHITKFVTEAKAPAAMSIPASDCTGVGYNTTPTPIDDDDDDDVTVTPASYRYCYEDQFPSPGDYDFNDCVMTVTPSVNGSEVTLTVSLDAVGANKQIAAAMRIVGLDPSHVLSATCDYDDPSSADNLNWEQLITPCLTDKGDNVRYVNPQSLGQNEDGSQITDFVLCLFNDAHLVMSGTDFNQYTHSYFYNTLDPNNTELKSMYLNEQTNPVVMTYTFNLSSESDAQLFNNVNNLDVFIVEQSTGRYWEVHTYPFKFDQVLQTWANYSDKLTSYQISATRNYPWALQVPGTFRYPIEWQSICGGVTDGSSGIQFGHGVEAYPYFRSWAFNKDSEVEEVKHWYNYIGDESVVWE